MNHHNHIMRAFFAMSLLGALSLSALAQGTDYSTIEEKVTPLGHNMYDIDGNDFHSTVAVGSDGIIIADAQPAPLYDKLKAAIAGISPLPVKYVINSHYHPNMTGGNAGFRKDFGAHILAYKTTLDRMQHPLPNTPAKPAPADSLPDQTFDGGTFTLKADGLTARLVHLPKPAHTDADTIVFWPAANVISVGDLVASATYPDIDVASGGSADGLIIAANYIIAHSNAKTKIVAGHGPVTNRAGIIAYRDMLKIVLGRIAKAKAAGQSEDEVANSPTLLADMNAKWAVPNANRFPHMVYQTVK